MIYVILVFLHAPFSSFGYRFFLPFASSAKDSDVCEDRHDKDAFVFWDNTSPGVRCKRRTVVMVYTPGWVVKIRISEVYNPVW